MHIFHRVVGNSLPLLSHLHSESTVGCSKKKKRNRRTWLNSRRETKVEGTGLLEKE